MHDDGYVIIDGEAFRDAHSGFQEAIENGHQHGCTYWGAYVAIRENINNEKQLLLENAMKEKKNLIIPSTCLRTSQCLDVAEMLQNNGYAVHIVGVYGDKETIIKRGRKRASFSGKRYDPREFELALTRFAPMLRRCTGKWQMVCTTGDVPFLVTGQGSGPLVESEICTICGDIFKQYS